MFHPISTEELLSHHYTRSSLFLGLVLASTPFALDDQPLYLDAGCPNTGIPGSDASGSMTMAVVDGKNGIPITCTGALTGSDAIALKAPAGNWWNCGIKTPTDRSIPMKGYKDVRFWVKNNSTSATSFTAEWQTESWSFTTGKPVSIPAKSAWQEIIIPLTDFSGSDTAVKALYFRSAANTPAIDILIDSVTITDGTSNRSLAIPSGIPTPLPSAWPKTFLIGGLDKTEVGKSTKEFQAGGSYRYQYVMKETQGYYSPTAPNKGEYVADYAKESENLGVKSAFVWYNLGKSGEGYLAVTANLASATYMEDYFTRYEWLLDQMVKGGQKDYMIVLEPDMYGFLTRGLGDNGQAIPTDDPTRIPVAMTKANSLSGKTYAANMKGWAEYMVARAKDRLKDQGVIVGHMPNHWGVNIPGQVGRGRIEAHLFSGMTTARFINGFGAAGKGDVVFVEKTDYDAGIKGAQWFWDSTSYAKFFTWTRAIAHGTGLPMVGWQMAQGNLNHATATKRDDIVETFLAHPKWWTDGGFIGILFGGGNPGCANYSGTDDEGWYNTKMSAYNLTPLALPLSSTGLSNSPALKSSLEASAHNGMLRLSGWTGTARVQILDASGKELRQMEMEAGQSIPLGQLRGVLFARVFQSGILRTAPILVLP
jgi:hypothetical protein